MVFNYPGCPERPDEFGGFDKYPVDLRTNYIKRCIGIGGDVIESKNAEIYINGNKMDSPPNSQKWCKIECNTNINPKLFTKLGITDRGSASENGKFYYDITTTESALAELKTWISLPMYILILLQKATVIQFIEVSLWK